jgi:sporulation protein YlmC with PRC-barrel domain
MEPMLNFINKFTTVVKSHIAEAREIVGKEVVDSTASKSGIVIDKVKVAFGAKFSLLGYNYSKEEISQIDSISEDVIVCQSADGKRFFLPASEIVAVGESVLLVRPTLNLPDINGSLNRRKEEVFRKFFHTKESIKVFLPKVEEPRTPRKKAKRSITHLFH